MVIHTDIFKNRITVNTVIRLRIPNIIRYCTQSDRRCVARCYTVIKRQFLSDFGMGKGNEFGRRWNDDTRGWSKRSVNEQVLYSASSSYFQRRINIQFMFPPRYRFQISSCSAACVAYRTKITDTSIRMALHMHVTRTVTFTCLTISSRTENYKLLLYTIILLAPLVKSSHVRGVKQKIRRRKYNNIFISWY